jgi:hypothetical protein
LNESNHTYRENEQWIINGKFHRENGPADICYDSYGKTHSEEWYLHDQLHRIDGPAVTKHYLGEIRQKWYLNGVKMTEEEHAKAIKDIAL